MNDSPSKKAHHILKVALGVALAAIVILSILLIRQYQHVRRMGYVGRYQSLFSSLHGSGPLTAAYASSTEAWMTFDYINRAFAMPPQYLKTTLEITDSRYPRLTIAKYAQSVGLSQAVATQKVQDAIRAFFNVTQ